MIGMDALGTPALLAGAPPPNTLSAPAAVEPRAVEGSAQSSLESESDAMSYNPSRAVLQLVRRSAEAFAALVMSGQDRASAAAMTGTPETGLGKAGALLDEYA